MRMKAERSSPSSSSPSKALHNFTMPCGLRWGNQRFLRCMKVNSNGQILAVQRRPSSTATATSSSSGGVVVAASGSHMLLSGSAGSNDEKRELGGLAFRIPPEKRLRVADGGGEGGGIGIAAVREKVILDLQSAADKMKDAIFRRERFEGSSDEPTSSSPPLPAAEEAVRPWSLRTRRASFRLLSGSDGTGVVDNTSVGGVLKNLNVDVVTKVAGDPTPRLRSGAAVAVAPPPFSRPSAGKKERAKFCVPLSRREIEEDFMAILGHRPARRPKKRPKYIQKQLDTLFPGLWLTEITADIYKVPETQ